MGVLPIHRSLPTFITNMVAKLLSLYLLVVASLGVVQAGTSDPNGGPDTLTTGPSSKSWWRRGLILDGGAVARGPTGTLTQGA
ncbi:hypothetical protein BGY98DRAFT_1014413 [Russula aff. rugulosa BPL654]|nr:hypothetical protein BGY98DRAFT_1014413 [Russula aff. rugulosa BPL654]